MTEAVTQPASSVLASTTDERTVDLAAYALEPLHRNDNVIVYRGTRRGEAGEGPASVLVREAIAPSGVDTTLRYGHRHLTLQRELDDAWSIRPLALQRRGDRTVLVLEDPGGEPLDRWLSDHPGGLAGDLTLFLELAIGLTSAVRAMHASGLVHLSLKPFHVWIDPSTRRSWLTGFGLSTRQRVEQHATGSPNIIAGSLAYMAPEQTGLMNRSVDARTDLYSLGVTLYEVLTGSLPFAASEPGAWMHAHVAQAPLPPTQRTPGVPPAVSAIIMKLLAKAPDDRYQTAGGVEHDLRRCLEQWTSEHRIGDVPLAVRDVPDRLVIPERLYGRTAEVEALLAAFERVARTGKSELVLVAGSPGVGKSALVRELECVAAPGRGLFASGRLDQQRHDIPYAPVVRALAQLVERVLAAGDEEFTRWRASLQAALGPNGRLMTELVPTLALIVGEQAPAPEISAHEAQLRLRLVVQRLLEVFAQAERPLVLFLDDLQWFDAATLDLIAYLMTRSDLHHTLVIGAYRDDPIDAAQPFASWLETMRRAHGTLSTVVVPPLAPRDLTRLVADALHTSEDRVGTLAALVHVKTVGNPLFSTQFLASLIDEGLVTFDHATSAWTWDLSRIRAKGYTDNLVELLIGRLARLPAPAREALLQIACLGNEALVSTLAALLGVSEADVDTTLAAAVRAELVDRREGAYAFVHDRVREAAYSLIPAPRRADTHLRIGRLLLAGTSADQREDALFEIVTQLNRGAASIDSDDERAQLAELNLAAGLKARAAAAFEMALAYFSAGVGCLGAAAWAHRRALMFALELNRAECEYVTGAQTSAASRLAMLAAHASTTTERISVGSLGVDFYMATGQARRGIEVGLECLQQMGIAWPLQPTEEDAQEEYERVVVALANRSVEDLVQLPAMTGPGTLAMLDLLTRLASPAFFLDPNLYALIVCRAVGLSVEHGNADASCDAYVRLGILAGERFRDYRAGLRFGEVGYLLAVSPGPHRWHARTQATFAAHLLPAGKPLRASVELLRAARQRAMEAGDLLYAAYSDMDLIPLMFAEGGPLDEVQREAERALAFVSRSGVAFADDALASELGLIRMLRGVTHRFGSFNSESMDERQMEEHLVSTPNPVEQWYWLRKVQAHYYAGEYESALAAVRRTGSNPTVRMLFLGGELHFFSALVHAACWDGAAATERQQHVDSVVESQRHLQTWALTSPENFSHRAALVGAELARIEGRRAEAMDLYEQAIRFARDSGFVQHEALGYEVAARFYAGIGFEQFARLYLRHARRGYAQWGADGKVRQLESRHPHLLEAERLRDPRSTLDTALERLDIATVVRVSQAVSGELEPDRVIDALLRTALEQAGADRGVLLLSTGGELRIRADATTQREGPAKVELRDAPLAGSTDVPESVVQYAARTREHVLLADPGARGPFASDPYIRRAAARSMLCMPLMKHGRLVAMLYLENHLAPDVFTPARSAVLTVLASAAAMALDNSRLYRELQEREAKIRQLVDANLVGVLITTLAGDIIEANDAFLQMVRYTRDDVTAGRIRWTELTPPDWQWANERALAQLRATGACELFEKEYVRRDGTRVPVLVTSAVIEGTTQEAVTFVLDLTERKRAEDERDRLRQLEADLAHINRVSIVGELAGSLAHEVRQPLTAAVLNAQATVRWLDRPSPDVIRASRAATKVVEDATQANAIIERVRSLYRREAPQRDRVDVNEVIAEMVTLLSGRAHRQGVFLHAALDDTRPVILGDRVQLQQVLMNLMLNGIEAMQLRGGTLNVSSARTPGGEVLVAVRDDGVGLPPEGAERLFAPFVTTKPQGTGMGLAISRRIVEAHGGRLWATANPDRGATFRLTLPLE